MFVTILPWAYVGRDYKPDLATRPDVAKVSRVKSKQGGNARRVNNQHVTATQISTTLIYRNK